jgi:hypothetical protein
MNKYVKRILVSLFFLIFVILPVASIINFLFTLIGLNKYLYKTPFIYGIISLMLCVFYIIKYLKNTLRSNEPFDFNIYQHILIAFFTINLLLPLIPVFISNGEHSQLFMFIFLEMPTFPGRYIMQKGIVDNPGYITINWPYSVVGPFVTSLFWTVIYTTIVLIWKYIKKNAKI